MLDNPGACARLSFHTKPPGQLQPRPPLRRCSLECCRCDDVQHELPPASADAGVAAVAEYITARRAEVARQSQRLLQQRKAEMAEQQWKQEQEQKRKEARKRKREREEQARLRARFGDAIPSSEGALEVSAVAVSADAAEGVLDAVAVRGASSEPCNEGPVYDLGLPSGFDDSVVPMAC